MNTEVAQLKHTMITIMVTSGVFFSNDQSSLNYSLNYIINLNTASVFIA